MQLACWTQVQKGPGSNRSRDAYTGKLFIPIVPLFTNRDQPRNPTLGNQVWLPLPFFTFTSIERKYKVHELILSMPVYAYFISVYKLILSWTHSSHLRTSTSSWTS